MQKECAVDAIGEHEIASLSNAELMGRLRSRASQCTQKSMTARLTAVIDLAEELFARGYDRSQARDIFIEIGWEFTSNSFDSALSRVRKRRLQTRLGVDPLEACPSKGRCAKAQIGHKSLYSGNQLQGTTKDTSIDSARRTFSEIFASPRCLPSLLTKQDPN